MDLNVDEFNIDTVVEAEKVLKKRQSPFVEAELINDIGGSRYTCPPNYKLEGSRCIHVDCMFENIQGGILCLIPATPILSQPQCSSGNNQFYRMILYGIQKFQYIFF